jgi:hypothetical protein
MQWRKRQGMPHVSRVTASLPARGVRSPDSAMAVTLDFFKIVLVHLTRLARTA